MRLFIGPRPPRVISRWGFFLSLDLFALGSLWGLPILMSPRLILIPTDSYGSGGTHGVSLSRQAPVSGLHSNFKFFMRMTTESITVTPFGASFSDFRASEAVLRSPECAVDPGQIIDPKGRTALVVSSWACDVAMDHESPFTDVARDQNPLGKFSQFGHLPRQGNYDNSFLLSFGEYFETPSYTALGRLDSGRF